MPAFVPTAENVLNFGAVPDKRPQSRPKNEVMERLVPQFLKDARTSEPWRRKARTWYAMRAGKQWDNETLAHLRNEQRPALTFNRTGAVINVVSGVESNNRQDVKVYPEAEGDAEVSEVGTQGINWFDNRCQASSEESHAFRDMLTCGVGSTETRIDYTEQRNGKGYREREYPLNMFWDADARKRNLEDARRVWRIKVMELAQAKEEYPDADPATLDATWTGLSPKNLTEVINESVRDYRYDNHDAKNDMVKPVRIVQAQWWEKKQQHYVYVEAEGRDYPIAAGEARNYRGVDGYRVRKVPTKVWYYAILGDVVLDWGELAPQGQFHFKFMTGEFNEENEYWQGLMEPMMDPQQWLNKVTSSIVHILASQSKGGVMFETDAFVNPQKALADWTKPNARIEMTSGALSGQSQTRGPKVQEKPVGGLPQGLEELLRFATVSIYECPGVPFELLAQQQSGDTSGVQEFERTRRGINVLANYFDSLRLYRIQQASLTLDFLRSFFQDQLMRVTVEGKKQYVKFALDPAVEQYDFVIDDTPTAPNMKERTWQLLLPLLPIMVQLEAPPEMWTTVLEYSPLPSDLVAKLTQSQDEGGEQSEEEQVAFQLQMRQIVAAIEKMESETRENMAQAQAQQATALLNMTKAGEIGPRLTMDGLKELHEMKVSEATPPNRKQVVDIQ